MLSTSVLQCTSIYFIIIIALKKIDLRHCKLNDNDIKILCESLQYNNTIREMYIGDNPYGLMALESIVKLLKTNHSITQLGDVDLMPEVMKNLSTADQQTVKTTIEQIYLILNDVRLWLNN